MDSRVRACCITNFIERKFNTTLKCGAGLTFYIAVRYEEITMKVKCKNINLFIVIFWLCNTLVRGNDEFEELIGFEYSNGISKLEDCFVASLLAMTNNYLYYIL
jgi:hypothetical protein